MHDWPPVPRLGAVIAVMLGVHCWVQVHIKREDIKAKHHCNDPLEDSGRIVILVVTEDDEGNGQANGDENEHQLDPERDGEHAVLRVVYTQTLVLGANEDGRDEVANDEEAQKDVVQSGVTRCVKDGQANQTNGSNQGPENGEPREHFLAPGGVGHETAAVAEPAVREKRRIEEDGGEHAAGDEQWLELAGANV